MVAKQTQALQGPGQGGQEGPRRHRHLHRRDQRTGTSSTAPRRRRFTRNDIYALNALKDQFLGEGGGDEARRSQFLGGLQDRLGTKKGVSVFNDLRQFKNKGVPTTIDGKFPYGKRHARTSDARAASSSTTTAT